MKKMTIKDLKQIIENLPDDMPVMGETIGATAWGGYIIHHRVERLVGDDEDNSVWPKALILALDEIELL